MPTTEVAIRSTLRDDVYVIMSSVNPETKLGTFRVIVRPLVAWIWIGGLMLLCGRVRGHRALDEASCSKSVRSPLRAGGSLARPAMASWLLFVLALLLALGLGGAALAQDSSSPWPATWP